MEQTDGFSLKLLCMACLNIGRSVRYLTNDKLKKFYLDALNEIPLFLVHNVNPCLCVECETLLKKAVNFREQVKDSYRALQTFSLESLQEPLLGGSSRLSVRANSPISIEPEKDSELDLELKHEVKVEWIENEPQTTSIPTDNLEGYANSDHDVDALEAEIETLANTQRKASSKMRRARKIARKIHNGAKTKRTKKLDDQKILTINLSYEEMLLERDKESKKESYVKAQYKCETCLVGFNYKKSYKAHIAAKHSSKQGDYICPVCKIIISSVESFTSHYKRHMRRYECSICQKRTMNIKVMQQHYYSTHEISLKEYKCELCGKVSSSADTHRYHKDTHKARVQCTECDKTFTHRAGLLNHRLSVHEFNNAFPCNLCDKVFRWKTSLKRHLDKHQLKRGSSAACCIECGVTFSSVCSYQRHMKNSLRHVTHDQLRFICDHCNRRFADKTKLRDHIEEKHLFKTYQCHICLKPSKNRVSLDQHIRNVHKGRQNNKICHHCGKGFPTKLQLESHIRTHTGERPFICEFCPTTFSQKSNLYKHNRQVHLNIKSKRYPLCKRRKDDKPVDPPPEIPPMDPYRPVAVLHYSPERGFVM